MSDGRVTHLRPYVSRLALEWADQEPARRWKELDATCCFVDISGFTALSERLARQGRVGAEELTVVLDQVFGELLGVAYEQGGTLLKFGGDALLLAFDGERHPERAAWAAIGMRSRLRSVGRVATEAGNVRLRMSVGVHTGTFQLFRVGHSHQELIVAGPAATTTTEMEAAAEANEILVSPATAARLDPSFVQGPTGPGLRLRDRRSWVDGPGPQPVDPTHLVHASTELSVALREHLSESDTEPEHRLATIGFVKFTGTDELLASTGADAVAAELQDLVAAIQVAVDEEGVTFLASDIDNDGGKIILSAGVPATREDDEGRMLRAARSIVERDHGLAVRVGVNSGHVFAGEIGTQDRRTYTVIGDPVNLAARLMAAAPRGHVYASPAVVERSRSDFDAHELERFQVKGKALPVRALDVGPLRRETDSSGPQDRTPFSGRQAEIDELMAVVARVRRTGTGRSVEIVGDVGSGKSRILRELLARCVGFRRIGMRAEPFWTTSPYLPVRLLLRRILPGEGDDPEHLADRLSSAVADRAPELAPWLPLLGEILAVDVPRTPEVDRLEPRFRRERRDLVGAQLLVALLGDRVILSVDDVHWLDEPSRDLLQRIRVETTTRPWLIISTSRPPGTSDPDLERYELRDLAPSAIRSIIAAATDDDPLHPHEVDAIVERANGNPLFCEELVRAVSTDRDLEHLPDSIEAVASAGIDSLPPPARRALRFAAVLGTTFRREALEELLGEEVGALDAADRDLLGGFLVADGPVLLRFRNPVVRDAAYHGLSYRRRRELHARAGRAVEQRYSDRLDAYAELLANHFHAAADPKAWSYACRAADLAAAADANAEAAALYRLALDAAKRSDVHPAEEAAVLERLGDTGERAGLYGQARDAYRAAAAHRADDPLEVGRLLLKQVKMGVRTEPAASLTRLVGRARRTIEDVEGDEAAKLRAELLAWQAMIRRRQGRHRDASRLAAVAIDEAEHADQPHALALALNILDWVSMESGQATTARYGERVVDIYHRLGDRQLEGNALTNLGAFAYFEGDWGRARELYERAVATFVDGGCLSAAAFAQANLGELLVNQGRSAEVEERLRDAYRTLRAANDIDGAGFAAQQLARIASEAGRAADADRYFDDAFRLWDTIGDARGMLELRLRRAEAMLARGSLPIATILLGAIGPVTPWEEGLGWVYDRLDALRLAAGDRHEDARDLLGSSVRRSDGGGPYERFQILDAYFGLGADEADSEADGSLRDEMDRLELALGIVTERELRVPVSASVGRRRS